MAEAPPLRVRVIPELDLNAALICSQCKAVVADMPAHEKSHRDQVELVRMRFAAVTRRVDALASQARSLLSVEHDNRDVAVDGLQKSIDRLDDQVAALVSDNGRLINKVRVIQESLERERERHDQFLYDVATCPDCTAVGRQRTLCPHHSAMVAVAREEVHAQ